MDQLDPEERKDARIREDRTWREVSWEVAKEYIWIDSTSLCTSISEKLKNGRKTGAFFSSLPIICRFFISGALPQFFRPFTFLGHCPSFFTRPYFLGIAPAFSLIHIPGALPQLFHPTIFLGHCPSFFHPYGIPFLSVFLGQFNSCQKI